MPFFQLVLMQDSVLLAQVKDFGRGLKVDVGEALLVFGLEDLHALLVELHYLGHEGYRVFKKQLYQSDLNESLKRLGGEVQVFRSTGKIEQNLYQLVRFKQD
ncbi:MAG: hypothetical protein HON94_04530 [Methylococcales bacterium]|nr:hypothetical protein [Methylococcales bacterium]MBT5228926.1 hypothetical protein [Methylococcales bacterium]MBT7444491.1 hypothetical protein [Methylococcales bacterium]